MATLTANELAELRAYCVPNMGTAHWTKTNVNAALQAVEDRMQLAATKTAIGSDIEAAAPGVFSAAEKTKLFAIWAVTFARRQGII